MPATTTSTTSSLPRSTVTSARTAVFVVFALAGVAFASLASRIADTKVALGLSAGELGLDPLRDVAPGSVTRAAARRAGSATGSAPRAPSTSAWPSAVDGPARRRRGRRRRSSPRWLIAAGLFLIGLGRRASGTSR